MKFSSLASHLSRLAICSALSSAVSAFAGTILIDSFETGFTAVQAGTLATNTLYHPPVNTPGVAGWVGPNANSVIGGRMQAWDITAVAYEASGMTIDTVAGTLNLWGPGRGPDQLLQYGSAIGPAQYSSFTYTQPFNLNLHLTTSDSLRIDVAQLSDDWRGTGARSMAAWGTIKTSFGNVNWNRTIQNVAPGSYSFTLGSLGLNDLLAGNIQGFSFEFSENGSSAANGTKLSSLSIETVPEKSSAALVPFALGLVMLAQTIVRRRRPLA